MNQPAIDQATYRELEDATGADFVTELVGTFLEEAPQMMAELRRTLAAGDADAFRRAAHSLKSNANTFGALPLGTLARELELGGLPEGTAQLDALEAEYERAAGALKELGRG